MQRRPTPVEALVQREFTVKQALRPNAVVFFDLDGTLEDSRRDMALSVNRVRTQFGLAPFVPLESVFPYVNGGMTNLVTQAFADAPGISPQALTTAYENDYYNHIADHTQLYSGIQELLETLLPLAQLVVVTNKPQRHSDALLRALGIDHFFAAVMGGDSCAATKPDPLPLLTATQRLQLSPGNYRACMIGDSAADLLVAQRFQIPALWCSWGYTPALPPDFSHTPVLVLPRDAVAQVQKILGYTNPENLAGLR